MRVRDRGKRRSREGGNEERGRGEKERRRRERWEGGEGDGGLGRVETKQVKQSKQRYTAAPHPWQQWFGFNLPLSLVMLT